MKLILRPIFSGQQVISATTVSASSSGSLVSASSRRTTTSASAATSTGLSHVNSEREDELERLVQNLKQAVSPDKVHEMCAFMLQLAEDNQFIQTKFQTAQGEVRRYAAYIHFFLFHSRMPINNTNQGFECIFCSKILHVAAKKSSNLLDHLKRVILF